MGVLLLGAFAALVVVSVIITQAAWNGFVSPVFGLPAIDLSQTLAFLWLVALIKAGVSKGK